MCPTVSAKSVLAIWRQVANLEKSISMKIISTSLFFVYFSPKEWQCKSAQNPHDEIQTIKMIPTTSRNLCGSFELGALYFWPNAHPDLSIFIGSQFSFGIESLAFTVHWIDCLQGCLIPFDTSIPNSNPTFHHMSSAWRCRVSCCGVRPPSLRLRCTGCNWGRAADSTHPQRRGSQADGTS